MSQIIFFSNCCNFVTLLVTAQLVFQFFSCWSYFLNISSFLTLASFFTLASAPLLISATFSSQQNTIPLTPLNTNRIDFQLSIAEKSHRHLFLPKVGLFSKQTPDQRSWNKLWVRLRDTVEFVTPKQIYFYWLKGDLTLTKKRLKENRYRPGYIIINPRR